MNQYKGSFEGKGKKIAVVVSEFNEMICSKLLGGCLDTLKKCKVADEDVDVYWTPGAFEIPVVAKKLAESKKYSAVVCLGAVIRGETPHFDYVCTAVTRGVSETAYETGIPVIFGVVTTDTQEQAMDRAGVKAGNKGSESALTAIQMANLIEQI